METMSRSAIILGREVGEKSPAAASMAETMKKELDAFRPNVPLIQVRARGDKTDYCVCVCADYCSTEDFFLEHDIFDFDKSRFGPTLKTVGCFIANSRSHSL